MNRIKIVRLVNGDKKELKVKLARSGQAGRHDHRPAEVLLISRDRRSRAVEQIQETDAGPVRAGCRVMRPPEPGSAQGRRVSVAVRVRPRHERPGTCTCSTTSRCSTSGAGRRSRRFVARRRCRHASTRSPRRPSTKPGPGAHRKGEHQRRQLQGGVRAEPDPDDYYQTQYKLLQSRALARRTLDSAEAREPSAVEPERRRISVETSVVARALSRYRRRGPRPNRRPSRPRPDETRRSRP